MGFLLIFLALVFIGLLIPKVYASLNSGPAYGSGSSFVEGVRSGAQSIKDKCCGSHSRDF